MRKGHWSEHEYHRRKCAQEGGDFTGFIGWKRLTELVELLDKRTEDLFLVLFFTGARANELLLYKGMNFKITDKTIDVVSAPAFKKFRRKRFDRDEVWGYRHFAINRQEPLTNNLIGFLEPKREDKPIFDFSYSTVYRLIADIQKEKGEKHGPWWPHRIRAERASQLAEDYSATTHMLKDYFNWSRDETPNFYVKLSMRAWKKVYGAKETIPEIPSSSSQAQKKEVPTKKSTYELFEELQSKH